LHPYLYIWSFKLLRTHRYSDNWTLSHLYKSVSIYLRKLWCFTICCNENKLNVSIITDAYFGWVALIKHCKNGSWCFKKQSFSLRLKKKSSHRNQNPVFWGKYELSPTNISHRFCWKWLIMHYFLAGMTVCPSESVNEYNCHKNEFCLQSVSKSPTRFYTWAASSWTFLDLI
jgi:hypothetical protein